MEKATGRRVYHRRTGQSATLRSGEKRRLIQLGICLLLFLTIFFAKGADRLSGLRTELTGILQGNADFRAAFADLGWSVSSGRPVGKTLNELWTGVFLAEKRQSPASWRGGEVYQAVLHDLKGEGGAMRLLDASSSAQPKPADPMALSAAKRLPPPEDSQTHEEEPAIVYMDYHGPALPDNTTMDRYALGLDLTVSPVPGRLTSEFGWREHPIEGGDKFHFGVDMKADSGTPVLAFAAGAVDYIGESDIYGQYLQLRHGNGVTSFYAHCSRLCVQQGQVITAGEKVAESGATGEVTGPHLHFELKKDGIRLNPAYYIDNQP